MNKNKGILELRHTGVFTRNYNAFHDPHKRFIVNQGGSRSGKTIAICQLILWYALTYDKKIISIVRKTSPALRATVYKDFISLLHEYGIYKSVKHNDTNAIIRFPNFTELHFFSVDDPQKLRGRKHDLIFINEANELSAEDFTQLNIRNTGKIILDWNPSDPFSWILDLKKDDKTELIHSTYRDNPFLPEEIVREIEDLINKDSKNYQIFALGLLPLGEDIIFPDIHYTKFPEDVEYRQGMDFGFVDPNTLCKTYVKDGKLYIKELIYESYLTTEDLIIKMNTLNISKRHMIYADAARPDQIKSIANAGYSIMAGNKKIQEGLDFMRSHEIHIDPSSTNAIKEFKMYSYKKIRGIVSNDPIDLNNHLIDAARYSAISWKGGTRPTFIAI